jgi:hypothetical protein
MERGGKRRIQKGVDPSELTWPSPNPFFFASFSDMFSNGDRWCSDLFPPAAGNCLPFVDHINCSQAMASLAEGEALMEQAQKKADSKPGFFGMFANKGVSSYPNLYRGGAIAFTESRTRRNPLERESQGWCWKIERHQDATFTFAVVQWNGTTASLLCAQCHRGRMCLVFHIQATFVHSISLLLTSPRICSNTKKAGRKPIS